MNYTIKIRNIYTYNKIDLKIHTNEIIHIYIISPFKCKRKFINNIWEYGHSYGFSWLWMLPKTCAWTFGQQQVILFWEIMESLRGKACLVEVGY